MGVKTDRSDCEERYIFDSKFTNLARGTAGRKLNDDWRDQCSHEMKEEDETMWMCVEEGMDNRSTRVGNLSFVCGTN